MAKSFATLIDEIQSDLGGDTTTYTDAIVTVQLEKAIRKVSDSFPRLFQYTYKLESRKGTTTSYLNTWLMDTTKDQFVPISDVGKVIKNTTTGKPTDWAASTAYTKGTRVSPTSANGRRYICSTAGTSDTTEPTWPVTVDGTVVDGTVTWMHRGLITEPAWAKVLSSGSNSGTQLNLSKDMMASGEGYEMFNKECWNNKQIYLGDVTDYIGDDHGVVRLEYPVGTRRNFTIDGDILTISLDSDPPDSGDPDSDVEVYVWIKRRHQVTQQTITTLYVDLSAGYAAGSTAILVDYDGGTVTGTIKEGTNFTIADTRGDYMVKADATFSGNEVTLQIFPGLENDIADDKTIWLLKSSLDNELERLVVELGAAYSALSIQADEIPKGGEGTYRRYESKLAIALSELARLKASRKPVTKHEWPRD